MAAAWVRVTALVALLTLAASDRALALWAGACAVALGLGGLLLGPLLDSLAVSQALDPAEVFEGEPLQVHLRLANRALLPVPALRCEVVLPRRLRQPAPRWLASLSPGQTLEGGFPIRAARRGVYRVGEVRLEAGDWFGLWRREGFVEAPLWLTVYPRPVPATMVPPPPRLPAGDRAQPASPFRAWEPAGLREYRRGDPPRWIAWRASAHRDDLVVREFPPVRDRATLVLLDLRPSAWPEPWREAWIERALSLAAAWTLQAAERGEALGLYAWGRPERFEPDPPGRDGSRWPGAQATAFAASRPWRARGGAGRRSPRSPLPGAEDGGAPSTDAGFPATGASEPSPPPAGPGMGYHLPVRRGPSRQRDVLRALALLHPADGPPFARGAAAALRGSPRSSVLWLGGRGDDDTFTAAAAAARAGHAVGLVVAPAFWRSASPAPGVTVWPLPAPEVDSA